MLSRLSLLFSVLMISILINVLIMWLWLLERFVLFKMIVVIVFSLYDFLVVGCVECRWEVNIVLVRVDKSLVKE